MTVTCYNGKFVPSEQPDPLANERGHRYGEGLFETIRIDQGHLLFASYHLDRLFSGMECLKISPPFSRADLIDKIFELCRRNDCPKSARVRACVLKPSDTNHLASFIIESWPIYSSYQWNSTGLRVDLFPEKADRFKHHPNLKTTEYEPYVRAASYARSQHLDDCLLLNPHGFLSDSSIANIFLVTDNIIVTPPLSVGCVAGVMRRYLLEQCKAQGIIIIEKDLNPDDLLQADEAFLTNVIRGIQWIGTFRNRTFKNSISQMLFGEFLTRLPSLAITDFPEE